MCCLGSHTKEGVQKWVLVSVTRSQAGNGDVVASSQCLVFCFLALQQYLYLLISRVKFEHVLIFYSFSLFIIYFIISFCTYYRLMLSYYQVIMATRIIVIIINWCLNCWNLMNFIQFVLMFLSGLFLIIPEGFFYSVVSISISETSEFSLLKITIGYILILFRRE